MSTNCSMIDTPSGCWASESPGSPAGQREIPLRGRVRRPGRRSRDGRSPLVNDERREIEGACSATIGTPDPDTILSINGDAEGRLEPCGLHDASVSSPATGEIQQLVFVSTVGDPDHRHWQHADSHQAARTQAKGLLDGCPALCYGCADPRTCKMIDLMVRSIDPGFPQKLENPSLRGRWQADDLRILGGGLPFCVLGGCSAARGAFGVAAW